MHVSNLSPVAQSQRIVLLDTLRGMAILGILMVNLPLMFAPLTSMLVKAHAQDSLINEGAQFVIKFFFEGKFYVLFSMLFGYGFWLFLSKKAGNANVTSVYLRRVLILLMFGILHVVLLWGGDILVFYALLGSLLMAFQRVSDRGLIKWAIALAATPVAITLLFWGLISLVMLVPEAKEMISSQLDSGVSVFEAFNVKAVEVYTAGSFADIVKLRLEEYKILLPGLLFFYPNVLAMFLLGVWAARRNLISRYREHLDFFRKAFWWGLFVGLPFGALFYVSFGKVNPSLPGPWEVLNSLSMIVGGFFTSLFYVSSVVLLISRGKLGFLQKYFAPVGRMALTNYLMHSIIGAFLFHSYGLGLFGKVQMWQSIVITLTIFALQIPLSKLWLKHFYFGPFEWVWRSLTYLKPQPFMK